MSLGTVLVARSDDDGGATPPTSPPATTPAPEGLLDFDAPVAQQLADRADWTAAHPTITPAQLVTNSSGLPGLVEGLGFGDYTCQFAPAGSVQECVARVFTSAEDDAAVIPPDTKTR